MNLEDFIKEYKGSIKNFNPSNIEHLRSMITSGVDSFNLKSFEEVEDIEGEDRSFLYVHSMAEENLLTKMIQLSFDHNSELTIEDVYQGRIIRQY
ncbi:hypothetical protein JOC85_003917 [Bacillus mesophilus]|uniref:Uncharacterized protein n=1 Tax=Bacillus mesophilus TaxID=1808955 RepID=A0A6M0QDE5_9BACI|nr:DUF6407 family protein [Bacillus mesophilus]MBM7663091.1 hypothetical protein [Bacillus mesophilus]NEY73590.1 hypothetical protein [Bacillus mesophilus]